MAFPEKYVAARVWSTVPIDVHNAHLVSGSSRGLIKVQMFEAIRRRIDRPTASARILCGDFNTPRQENDSSLTTWARPEDAAWDQAERVVLEHPQVRDVYRSVSKVFRMPATWRIQLRLAPSFQYEAACRLTRSR